MKTTIIVGLGIAAITLLGLAYAANHDVAGLGMSEIQFTLIQGGHRSDIPMSADSHWIADFQRNNWSSVTITNPNPQKYYLVVDSGGEPVRVRYSGRLVGETYRIETRSLADSSLVTVRYLQIS